MASQPVYDGAMITLAALVVFQTLAGPTTGGGYADGAGVDARFSAPARVAFCGSAFYVADAGNHAIRRVTRDGVVTTFAGALGREGFADGDATTARFNLPAGIAAAADCTLFIADTGNNAVRRISPDGVVSTIATSLNAPADVAVDANGTVYVSEPAAHTIRRIAPGGEPAIFAAAAHFAEPF